MTKLKFRDEDIEANTGNEFGHVNLDDSNRKAKLKCEKEKAEF